MRKGVTRAEMVKLVSKEANITSKAANKAINTLFGILHEAVEDQRSFVIPRVGTVSGYLRPARIGIDPRNGKKIMCKEKMLVRMTNYFKPKKERQI